MLYPHYKLLSTDSTNLYCFYILKAKVTTIHAFDIWNFLKTIQVMKSKLNKSYKLTLFIRILLKSNEKSLLDICWIFGTYHY